MERNLAVSEEATKGWEQRVNDNTGKQVEEVSRRVGRTATIDLSLWLPLVKKVDEEIGVKGIEAFRQEDGTFGVRVKPERAQKRLEELLKSKQHNPGGKRA